MVLRAFVAMPPVLSPKPQNASLSTRCTHARDEFGVLSPGLHDRQLCSSCPTHHTDPHTRGPPAMSKTLVLHPRPCCSAHDTLATSRRVPPAAPSPVLAEMPQGAARGSPAPGDARGLSPRAQGLLSAVSRAFALARCCGDWRGRGLRGMPGLPPAPAFPE